MTHKTPEPSAIVTALKSSPVTTLRSGLTWFGKEVLWSADIFSRLVVSVVVFRAVAKLTSDWLFPEVKQIWDQGDQLLKGFDGEEEETPPPGERPKLIFENVGWKFYQHRTVYQGQLWPCALLRPDPCATCEWFVPGLDGRNWCAAVAAVKTMHMEPYRSMTLYELKDALIQQYGDRRQRNGAATGNGYYTDPSRPGCM